ncbi:MAG: hypothetical protein RMJ37_00325 [Spirochaetia bacterium]|nr:hypothetical protein [Spirochaetota bacterium]MCX8097031.1 hypothetical protein [Spirochaetota bacterium]MDW8111774.1 hypothetical protein [Spirochaetia bacterium]
MLYNKPLEKIIISSVENKSSVSLIFIGERGTLKTFSSELVISNFLKDYDSYIPFNHNDIYVVGSYYYRLAYRFFENNLSRIISNPKLNEFFVRFVGFCIANRKLTDDKGIVSSIIYKLNEIRSSGREFKEKQVKSLLSDLEVVVSKLEKIRSIGIDVSREVIEFVSRTSFSGYKFVIFSEFENLTLDAQNSLLKTVEEPPKGVFFILLTSNYDKILPTIRSRTFKISFLRLKGSDIKFISENIDEDKYYSIYDIMVDNIYDIKIGFLNKFASTLSSGDLDSAMKFSEEVSDDEILVEKFFEVASKVLKSILEFRAKISGLDVQLDKEILHLLPKEILDKFTISKLYKLQSYLDEGYRNIHTFNINPRYVITNFFVEAFS